MVQVRLSSFSIKLDQDEDPELEEEDYGAEGDDGEVDEDMVALGYSEL
jgi:hypothetical protein